MTPTEARQIQADIEAIASKIATLTTPGMPTSDKLDEKQLRELRAFQLLLNAKECLEPVIRLENLLTL